MSQQPHSPACRHLTGRTMRAPARPHPPCRRRRRWRGHTPLRPSVQPPRDHLQTTTDPHAAEHARMYDAGSGRLGKICVDPTCPAALPAARFSFVEMPGAQIPAQNRSRVPHPSPAHVTCLHVTGSVFSAAGRWGCSARYESCCMPPVRRCRFHAPSRWASQGQVLSTWLVQDLQAALGRLLPPAVAGREWCDL